MTQEEILNPPHEDVLQFMVDIESYGLDGDKHDMSSIAILPFTLNGDILSSDPLCYRLSYPNRKIKHDPSTMIYRESKFIDEMEKAFPEIPYYELAAKIAKYVSRNTLSIVPNFWAKPIHFDFPYLTTFCARHGHVLPFHYRYTYDVRSFILGTGHDPEKIYDLVANEQKLIPHKAINDCYLQIYAVQKALAFSIKSYGNLTQTK